MENSITYVAMDTHKKQHRVALVYPNNEEVLEFLVKNAPAILEAWYPGEEGGTAIADVLFGDYNPGGKLPYTVYESTNQLLPQTEYDITKGFTYMYFTGRPLFPFGHGMSYTEFSYDNLQVSPKQIPANGQVTVSVEVENIGRRAGDEVVQLYVHDVQCSIKRPIKELRGFERVSLKPGEKRTVTFTLKGEQLAFYDTEKHNFVVEPGVFDVLVGSSSKAALNCRRLSRRGNWHRGQHWAMPKPNALPAPRVTPSSLTVRRVTLRTGCSIWAGFARAPASG